MENSSELVAAVPPLRHFRGYIRDFFGLVRLRRRGKLSSGQATLVLVCRHFARVCRYPLIPAEEAWLRMDADDPKPIAEVSALVCKLRRSLSRK